MNTYLQYTELTLKILAFVAATLFFTYKILTGWLIINMGVGIRIERKKLNDTHDHLSVIIALEKGSIDSVWLKDIQARLIPLNTSTPTAAFVQICGYSRLRQGQGQLNWDPPYSDSPLVLAPGDKADFAGYTTVPYDQPCRIEVVVLGDRPFHGIELPYRSLIKSYRSLIQPYRSLIQWQASAISLPENRDKVKRSHHLMQRTIPVAELGTVRSQ